MNNYITSKNELYKGNPLIEALPPVLEDIDVIERLCYYQFTVNQTEEWM